MPQLLEREHEIQSLLDALADACEHHGRIVLIGGEAGVGKSSLVQAFADSAVGVTTLTGNCDPLPTPPALGPLLDMASRLGPEFAALLDGTRSGPLLYPAVLAHLEALTTPTVLVFEDVHWADQATLELIGYLGRRIRRLPLLLTITYRSTEVGTGLSVLLGDLAGTSGVVRLELQPLSPVATAELAGIASPADVTAVYRMTGGNPFFISEIVRGGVHAVHAIPGSVRDAVLARIARLSSEAREALYAAAAIGISMDTGLLASVLESVGAPRWAIQEATSAGVLDHVGSSVRFRHELVQAAISAATPPAQAQRLHRIILALLQQDPIPPAEYADLVRHAELAGDNTTVLQLAPLAADRAAALGAHDQAAELYTRIIQRTRALPRVAADALERRGRAYYASRRFALALEDHQAAARLDRELGDSNGAARNLVHAAYLQLASGDRSGSEVLLRAATDLVEPLPPSRELAMAYEAWSRRAFVSNDSVTAEAWANRAVAVGTRLGDTELSLEAGITAAVSRLQRGDEAALPELESLRKLARERAHTELWAVDTFMRASFYLVLVPMLQRKYQVVDKVLPEALEYAHDRDLAYWQSMLACASVLRAMDAGRWDEAMERAEPMLASNAVWRARMISLICTARIRVRRGDDSGRQRLQEALDIGAADPAMSDLVRVAQAEVAFLTGQHAQSAASPSPNDAWMYGEWALWTALAGGAVADPETTPAEPYRLALDGRWKAAADFWEGVGCPYEMAVSLARTAEPDAVRRAIEVLDRLGATPAAAYARRCLREIGVSTVPRGPRATTSANRAGLTRREQEVLALVARGHSNAQVAERLFLSEKTVERHLSGVFTKLNVSSRGDAVDAARRLNALDTAQN